MFTILQAAALLRPGTTWNLRGDKLEQANDEAPRVSIPTQEELEAVVTKYAYADQRRAAYAKIPIGDQLDALWKIVTGESDAQAEAVRDAIQAVKDTYPKP